MALRVLVPALFVLAGCSGAVDRAVDMTPPPEPINISGQIEVNYGPRGYNALVCGRIVKRHEPLSLKVSDGNGRVIATGEAARQHADPPLFVPDLGLTGGPCKAIADYSMEGVPPAALYQFHVDGVEAPDRLAYGAVDADTPPWRTWLGGRPSPTVDLEVRIRD